MKQEVLFLLLNGFADWEEAYIAPCLNMGCEPGSEIKYVVKTLSLTKDPVTSCGGLKVLPDYDINSIPSNYAGIILIGGTSWFNPETEAIVPIIKDAIKQDKIVAGICNASVFLGMHGFLNDVKHTSNDLNYLKSIAGRGYNGEYNYVNEPAVIDRNIITANGLSTLEFCREILYALKADTPRKIEKNYRMYKTGIWCSPE